jgi:Spy/CpxP family protein refolding chaperone
MAIIVAGSAVRSVQFSTLIKEFSMNLKFFLSAVVIFTIILPLGAIASPDRIKQQLNLTPQQQQQLQVIDDNQSKQIEAVLTPEQQAKFDQAETTGQPMKQVLPSLELSPEQLAQIQKIQRDSKKQSVNVLTPEQKAQLESMRGKKSQN